MCFLFPLFLFNNLFFPVSPTSLLPICIHLQIVCLDCAGNYTEEELDVSLIVLLLILSVFLLILCSQCCSRFRARFSPETAKGIPPPPYIRRRYSYTVWLLAYFERQHSLFSKTKICWPKPDGCFCLWPFFNTAKCHLLSYLFASFLNGYVPSKISQK